MAKNDATPILVKNHTTSILTVPTPKLGGSVILMPGANVAVDPKAWAEASTAPMVKALLKMRKKGGLEVDEKTDASESLGDLDVNDAIDLVDETVDAATLKKWKKSETREEVLAALEVQIAKIDPRTKGDEGEGESAESDEQ